MLNKKEEQICANCGKKRIEHQEFGNYDSKALDNSCMKFKKEEEYNRDFCGDGK